MNLEFDDQVMIRRLHAELEGATYCRSASTFAAQSRTPVLAGATGVAAAVTAVTMLAWPGASSPALAWSPNPTAATADDQVAARTACSAGLEHDSTRAGDVLPSELPPIVALDLRGTGGLATFSGDGMTFSCLLVRDGDGFERGPIVGEATGTDNVSAALAVVSTSSTEWNDGRAISMISGVAPLGATTVEISIVGQPTATAAVTDGRFAMWWLGAAEQLSGSVASFNESGVELDRIDLGRAKGDGDRADRGGPQGDGVRG